MAVPRRLTEAEDQHAHAHAHAHAHEALVPHGGRYERHPRGDRPHAAGRDPAHVAEPRRPHLRQARDAQPDGLGQGPCRQVPDRRPRGARPAARGLDHPRADLGQHRDRAGDDRPAEGLPRRAGDARQRDQRAAPDGRAVRRRGHRLAGVDGEQRRDRAGQAPRQQGRAVRDALPVRQPGQPPGALRDDRPGDPRRLPRDRRLRGRASAPAGR